MQHPISFSWINLYFFITLIVSSFWPFESQSQDLTLVGHGAFAGGTLFSLKTDGTEFKTLKEFSSGMAPQDELLLFNNRLYGVTHLGGTHDSGIVYSLNVDGSDFKKIHDFDVANGSKPRGGINEYNGTLYGTTRNGGSNDLGVIYKINADGSNYKVLVNLDSLTGTHPESGLISNNGKLWGTTTEGGMFNSGVLYTLEYDGSSYTILHQFNHNDAAYPMSRLIAVENRIWGTTLSGSSNNGTIFSINQNGSDYKTEFVFQPSDGIYPYARLMYLNGYLWGTTERGGTNGDGSIYRYSLSGEGFLKVHDFGGRWTDGGIKGKEPFGGLTENGGKLWGMTNWGGSENNGIIYSIKEDGTGYTEHVDFVVDNGSVGDCNFINIKDELIGITRGGGTSDKGVVFKINNNGSGQEVIYDFNNINGSSISGDIITTNSKLYLTTSLGGSNGQGTLLALNYDGTDLEKIADFSEETGRNIRRRLTLYNGKLWGVTAYGGEFNRGTIFNVHLDGTNFTKFHDFDNSTGMNPASSLLPIQTKLYGTLRDGGSSGLGLIYTVDSATNKIEVILNNTDENLGSFEGDLSFINDKIWGTTRGYVHTGKYGIIYSLNPNGTEFSIMHTFSGTDGRVPTGGLINHDSRVYGMTTYGGIYDLGVIFTANFDGSDFKVIHEFNGENGANPNGQLEISSGRLFGITGTGGSNNKGVVFSIDFDGSNFTKLFDLKIGNGAFGSGSLLTLKSSQELNLESINKVYGDDSFILNATSNSDRQIYYLSSDTSILKVEGNIASIVGAGNCKLTAFQPSDSIYFEAQASANFICEKAQLLITANDVISVVGEPVPDLSMSYDKFVYDDSEEDIIKPEIFSEAKSNSPPGTYTIFLSGGSAANYELTLVNGIHTVSKVLDVKVKTSEPNYIYPNPATSSITVVEIDFIVEQLTLYDQQGRVVKSFTQPLNQYKIDDLRSGIYILTLKGENRLYLTKLVKE